MAKKIRTVNSKDKVKKSKEMSIFSGAKYELKFWRHPIETLRWIRRRFVMAHQRIHCGYCNEDWWEMYFFLTSVTKDMLKQMRAYGMSYPGTCTDEEWQEWLSTVIKYIEGSEEKDANDMTVTNITWEEYEDIVEEDKRRAENKDKAFDMLKEYWFALWD